MVYDISQELLSCQVFPGDPAPAVRRLQSIQAGDVCNLTALSLCAHNGTHVDAPYHFCADGRTIDQIPLETFVGRAFVTGHEGGLTAEDAKRALDLARAAGAGERILFRGRTLVTPEAARVFAGAGVKLLGVESQTFGPEDAPMEVHLILLGAEVVLLEGIRLAAVPDGAYLLCAAPLNLAGCDGAPCRAVLLDL